MTLTEQTDKLEGQDYIIVRADEDGVTVLGLTRGQSTKSHHSEKLDRGEVLIVQFTENTSGIKVKGKARIFTKYGQINAG